jgi:hypothetical protein
VHGTPCIPARNVLSLAAVDALDLNLLVTLDVLLE